MRAVDERGRELLVISDGQGLALSLKHQWEQRGLAVRQLSKDGLTIGKIPSERAALLVVDLDLPQPDALELCVRLGAQQAVPFIALLPRPDPGLAAAVLDRGADDCLARPFNPQELSMRIQAILRRTGAIQSGPPAPADNGRAQIRKEREQVKARTSTTENAIIKGSAGEIKRRRPSPIPNGDPRGSQRKETPSVGATRGASSLRSSQVRGDRGPGFSPGLPTRGPHRTTLAFVVLGALIAVSVVVASFGLGTDVTTNEQVSDEAELSGLVSPLLERLRQNPSDQEAMVGLGNAYYDHGQMEDAIPWYEQALAADPTNSDVRTDLGTAYFYSGNSETAKEQWFKVLEQEPNKAQTHYNLAVLYIHQTPPDNEAAAREWETVIRLAPDSEQAQSAEEQLSKLRGQ